MGSHRQPAEPRHVSPRLYLIATLTGDPDGDAPHTLAVALGDALGAGDVAAVLLRLPDGEERKLIAGIKAIASQVQKTGAALILDGRPDLVARSGADGAHMTSIEAFQEAVAALKPERIAGCGGIHSRHDAMLAAEAGADYLMFGEPDSRGNRPSLDAVLERVGWWTEVFEIPCVAYAHTLDEIGPLAGAGAEFIAAGDCIFTDPRGAAIAMGEASGRLAVEETVG
jgi:thiamine-phosphate pyrophosphorylase